MGDVSEEEEEEEGEETECLFTSELQCVCVFSFGGKKSGSSDTSYRSSKSL